MKSKRLTESLKIIESFSYRRNTYNEEKKAKIPAYILRYVENKLNGKNKSLVEHKMNDAIFYLEYFEGNFYITRRLEDGRETKLMLSDEEILMIKDTNNITKQDLIKLVNKIDVKEKRFGL